MMPWPRNLNGWAVKFIHKTPLISSWSSAGSMKSMRLKQKKAQVEALYLDLLPNP